MIDFKNDPNNKTLKEAVKKLQLRFPVAEIERAAKKGNISSFLNNKSLYQIISFKHLAKF
jgi:hypothetical protein